MDKGAYEIIKLLIQNVDQKLEFVLADGREIIIPIDPEKLLAELDKDQRLDKEADWLAEQLLCCSDDNRVDTCNYESCRRLCTSLVTTEGWRKAAREAVEKNNGSN